MTTPDRVGVLPCLFTHRYPAIAQNTNPARIRIITVNISILFPTC
jgi:hypothetical protein